MKIMIALLALLVRRSTSDAEAGEALFRAADAARYAARNGGRNRLDVA